MATSLRAVTLIAIVIGFCCGTNRGIAAEGAPSVAPPAAGTSPASGTATAPSVPAAATPAATPLPGHSTHGEVFDEGPRQRAYLMGGTGGVHFPITTRNPLAQQFFDQGVGQLHGFWYFEAERSFRQVAALDSNCAMAYWGMAMANANNAKRAKAFIEKATQKKAAASPREAAWIAALSESLAGPDSSDRRRKYVRSLEALVQDDPNDVEAKAFLMNQIWANGSWMTERKMQLPISSHQAYDALVDQILQVNPMHPAHHYRIHLWDNEKPARALISASLCGQTSPSIAHMWHMPGHTYSDLHRYADAAWQQEASARVDHAHMMRDGVLPDQIHNYAHNNEWLVRNLANLGRLHDAIDLATNMIELPRHPKYNLPTSKSSSASLALPRLPDVLEQFECWKEILAYRDTQYLPAPADNPDQRAERVRLLGLAAFGSGDLEEGRRQLAALDDLLKQKRAARIENADKAETKARAEKKSEEETTKAMAGVLMAERRGVRKLETELAELRGYAALAAGDTQTAKTELEKVKDSSEVSQEHLARAFSLCGDHGQAESIARKAVKDQPGEVYPQAILVEILERAGKRAEATAEFERLRPLAAHADLDIAVLRRLAPLAEQLHWPTDWRGSRAMAADTGKRPDLAGLGPFRWQPTPAVSWTVAGVNGQPLSLEQYRGKPVVVIFYLGSGCLHCVEQIQKFAPLTSEFAASGISITAISSEPLDSLKQSLAKLAPNQTVPFALGADPELAVFKSYRAFDDFENMPLHATYLIDAEGMVRWHDISYEPFTDASFLLGEARRLLGRK